MNLRQTMTLTPETMVAALVQVNEDNYVPAKMQVRMVGHPKLFTANFMYGDIQELRKDPKIVQIDVAEILDGFVSQKPTEFVGELKRVVGSSDTEPLDYKNNWVETEEK